MWDVAARAAIARRLESQHSPALLARLLASAWGVAAARSLARPLELPLAARVIGIGGATLGGACKTPFAIALAEALVLRGIDVALVGHAYRAKPLRPRIVDPSDRVADVGDDALYAARRLSGSRIHVVVAPCRQAAMTFAADRASFIVVDGLLQARPARIARSILLLDGARPSQVHYCPPAGDGRAPLSALMRAADMAVVVRDELEDDGAGRAGPPDAVFRLDQALRPDGKLVPLAHLAGAKIGLLLAVARPDRILGTLARRGIQPALTIAFPDHHKPTQAELNRATARTTQRIDAWLTTGKCATKLPEVLAGAPVLVLDPTLRLSDGLVHWVASERSSTEREPW
jgi:tetraacyldisaccharide 4'-kinase